MDESARVRENKKLRARRNRNSLIQRNKSTSFCQLAIFYTHVRGMKYEIRIFRRLKQAQVDCGRERRKSWCGKRYVFSCISHLTQEGGVFFFSRKKEPFFLVLGDLVTRRIWGYTKGIKSLCSIPVEGKKMRRACVFFIPVLLHTQNSCANYVEMSSFSFSPC